MDVAPINQLAEPLKHQIRASSIIPCFHNMVEELVYNAIDARAQSIDVSIDPYSASIKITDNGCGIDGDALFKYVGEWNSTSKRGTSTYGAKGEAIASIKVLSSRLTITTRPKGTATTYKKTFDAVTGCSQMTFDSSAHNGINKFGTTIEAFNLFHCFPVRLRAMKPDVEMYAIRDFIQKLSVLHHGISWKLARFSSIVSTDDYDIDNKHNKSNRKEILSLPSHFSVAKRFIALHRSKALLNMKAVRIAPAGQPFSISGMLSPPLSDSCHWTKVKPELLLISCHSITSTL